MISIYRSLPVICPEFARQCGELRAPDLGLHDRIVAHLIASNPGTRADAFNREVRQLFDGWGRLWVGAREYAMRPDAFAILRSPPLITLYEVEVTNPIDDRKAYRLRQFAVDLLRIGHYLQVVTINRSARAAFWGEPEDFGIVWPFAHPARDMAVAIKCRLAA